METKTKIRSFQDLEVWQRGHELVLKIYDLTKRLPIEESYGLTSQLQRAAVSITTNIAEGFSRYHYKDKVNFYYASRGSVSEVQNLLLVVRDVRYVPESLINPLLEQTDEIRRLLNGLVRSAKDQVIHVVV